ncbi:hypothetical protein AAU61_07480 [Desulfocarbo indianensis]|nr:hypothetical protein AAU61_07480 [Desulfocarbo indianensis]
MRTKPRILHWLALLGLALLLMAGGACQSTPYQRPELNLPAAWQGASGERAKAKDKQAEAEDKNRAALAGLAPDSLATRALGFNDPELGRLLVLALQRNNDLAVAALKVRQARLEAGLKADALYPTASANLSGEYASNLNNGQNSTSHGASGSLSYEVDLWGKLTSQRDMAAWEAAATEDDLRSAALTLLETTAELYFQTAYLNESIALGRKNIDRAGKSLELAQVRHRAGADSSLAEMEARRSLASLQANQEELQRQLAAKRTALAILFDGPPQGAVADPQRLPRGPQPTVAAGLPAEVLSRRPDLRAAESRLRKTLANVDATRTSYYPTLSLTGTLGSASSALLEVVKNPVASLLAGLSFPFLQWNEMQLSNELAQAQYEQAVVEFRQTLYAALKEVEDALSSRQHYASQGVKLQEALTLAEQVEGTYETRYRAGAESMQVWLDAQATRQEAEASLLQNRLNRLVNYLVLYQALGGEPMKQSDPLPANGIARN